MPVSLFFLKLTSLKNSEDLVNIAVQGAVFSYSTILQARLISPLLVSTFSPMAPLEQQLLRTSFVGYQKSHSFSRTLFLGKCGKNTKVSEFNKSR